MVAYQHCPHLIYSLVSLKCLLTVLDDVGPLVIMFIQLARNDFDFFLQDKNLSLKLDRAQFAATRIVLDCMRSMPTNVLLSEGTDLPLSHRSTVLATVISLIYLVANSHIQSNSSPYTIHITAAIFVL